MPPRLILSLLALAVACPLAAAAEALSLQPAQLKALGIAVGMVGDGGNLRSGTLPARVVVPNAQMRVVAAPVGGMIDMLAVAPGSPVKRGQVVAQLASPQALELQRDALQATSQLSLLQQNLKRDEQLFAEGLIAESRLQATRAAAAQAGAQASERKQGLALAGIVPGKLGGPLALVAPIDGVVLEQAAQLGQRVEAAAPIYRIAKLSPLWLEIQAPLPLAAGLREGIPVKLANTEVAGKLIAVGRAVDAASQTVLLRAAIGQGAETLTPGQVVEVELPAMSATAGSGHRLPTAALVRHNGQTFVFVQIASDDKGSRFEARSLRVLSQGGEITVAEGVRTGEQIAVKGVSALKAMYTGVGKE